jgi:hypothetical protein
VVSIAVQLGLYGWLLRRALLTRDISVMRPAIFSWLKVVLVWQVAVVVASATYVAVLGSMHPGGFAWVAPAIGAIFGTAMPLQVAVIAIMRAGRGS